MSAAEAQAFISEVWGLQGTAYLVVTLRYYSRVYKFGWDVLGWEDFFMLLATVSSDPSRSLEMLPWWHHIGSVGWLRQQAASIARLHSRVRGGLLRSRVLERSCE